MAYQTRDLVDGHARATPGVALADLKVDGGAAVNNGLMQFQADLLGTTRLPAGAFRNDRPGRRLSGRPGRRLLDEPGRDRRQLGARPRSSRRKMPAAERDRLYASWLKAVERSRDWQER